MSHNRKIENSASQEIVEQINHFDSLDKDFLEIQFSSYLNITDLKNMVTVSKNFNSLFSQPLLVRKLLEFVDGANYAEAKALVTKNSNLMFLHVSYKNNKNEYDKNNENRYEIISPLKLAFKLFDTYMWTIFKEAIQNNPQHLEQFKIQAHEQKEFLDLQLLFDAYQKYKDMYRNWTQTKVALARVNETLGELGKKQIEILPWHMIKEMCRYGEHYFDEYYFSKACDYNESTNFPKDIEPQIVNIEKKIKEKIIVLSSRLNSGYVLFRGQMESMAQIKLPKDTLQCDFVYHNEFIYPDLDNLKRLFNQRKSEFQNLLIEFNLSDDKKFNHALLHPNK